MLELLGEYQSTIDAKGRFLLPGDLRKQIPEDAGLQFVISRGFEKCLTLYPMQTWKPLYQKISALNQFDPKVRQFQRYFLNGATEVGLDSAGRLLLPKNLLEHASLKKDIVVVASGDKIEIWDSELYTQFFESFTSESFSRLANEVMNKPGDFPNF